MPELISIGKCLYCNEEFTKATITRHLNKHLVSKTGASKAGKSFLIKVEVSKKRRDTPYFLQLWVDGDTAMEELDDFLKGYLAGLLRAYEFVY